ncbi:Nn.00g070310.m01.CDS01 [Neocucurbitaria sp. VM-36]
MELNVAIIVACVGPYRTLFVRDGNPAPPTHRSRLNMNKRTFNVFTSANTHASRESEEVKSPKIEMRDLEQCVGVQAHASATGSPDSNTQYSERSSSSSRYSESWSPLSLTQIDPWYDSAGHAQIREFPEVLSPVPRAHHGSIVADLEQYPTFQL